MKLVIRNKEGYVIATKDFPDTIMIHRSVIEEMIDDKDLGKLVSVEVQKGYVRYITDKYIIEIWI